MKQIKALNFIIFIACIFSSNLPLVALANEENENTVYEVDKLPSPPFINNYLKGKKYFQRKLKNGGLEECQFEQARSVKSAGPYAKLKVVCGAIPGTAKFEDVAKCDSKNCEKKIINPDAELDSCKQVDMKEYSARAEEVIQQKAIIADACRKVGKPIDALAALYYPVTWLKTPPIPKSSQTAEVKTVLDFVVENGEVTMKFLDQAHQLYTQHQNCFEKRAQVFGANQAPSEADLKQKLGVVCSSITNAVKDAYKENLPKVRELLLLVSRDTSTGHSTSFIDKNRKDGFLNKKFDYIPGLKKEPSERPTSEEIHNAKVTYHKWVDEIEKDWKDVTSGYDFDEAKREAGNQNRYSMEKNNRRVVVKNDFPCGSVGTVDARGMQDCWEKTFLKKINEKREKAEKELQSLLIQSPILQVLTKKHITDTDLEMAYTTLQKRTKEAENDILEELSDAKKAQAQYRKKYQAWKDKKESQPGDPSVTPYKKIAAAQGTMEYLTSQDPKLCVAAEAFLKKRSRKELTDMGLTMGALVGATIVTGGAAGVLYGAGAGTVTSIGTGVIGGIGLGVESYLDSMGQRDHGRNLLATSFHDEFGKGEYISPGKLEKFLEANAATEIAKYTIFTPFPQDLVWTKALFTGQLSAMAAAIGSAASKSATKIPSYMAKSGNIDMKLAAGYLMQSQKQGVFNNLGVDKEGMGHMMRAIFGELNPSQSEIARTERIIEAVYNTSEGRLFKANPVKDPKKFEVEFQELVRFMQRTREKSFMDHVLDDDIVALIKLLQNKETGIPINDIHLKDILEVAHAGLQSGKTPDEVFDLIKRFYKWSEETGNTDHMAGLVRIWEDAFKRQEQRVIGALKKQGKTERDLARMSPAERRDFYRQHSMNDMDPDKDVKDSLRAAVTAQKKAAGEDLNNADVKKDIDHTVNNLLGCQRGRG